MTQQCLSDASRECNFFARSAAFNNSHAHIGTEHWLLGILNTNDPLAAGVLNNNGIIFPKAQNEIIRVVHRCEKPPHITSLPYTPRLHQVITATTSHAEQMQSQELEPIHFILGMLDVPDCTAIQVITKLGVNPDELRSEVEQVMTDGYVTPKKPYAKQFAEIKALLGDSTMTDEDALRRVLADAREKYP